MNPTRPDDGPLSSPNRQALPPPTAEEQAHSDKLVRLIAEETTASGGKISFARFMELALYAPGLGYYVAGKYKFGAQGDFVTAPELGSLFARCLAHQCQTILTNMDGGDVQGRTSVPYTDVPMPRAQDAQERPAGAPFGEANHAHRISGAADILEVGAGSGVLAADLLLALEAADALPDHYFILELSADLCERQAEMLLQKAPRLVDRVHWLDALPDSFRGIVLANELLDATPVERFRVTESGLNQIHVAWEDNRFVWQEQPIEAAIQLPSLPAGYVSEINLHAEAWVRSLGDILTQGVILLIDYGFPRTEFYHPQRSQGTLMCHYRHRAHDDPLILVGLQDITAHVDFTAMAEAGTDAGLSLLGYTSQAAFLLGNNLDQIVAASDPNDVRKHLELTQQIKKLTLPHEMGELFKVMALGRGMKEPLRGFSVQDRRGRL
jgi:SAM-dependent MidA family methyltransferase